MLHEFLDMNATPGIAVIGDAMIDEYYQVEITRVCPEAPTQVMHSKNDKPILAPGGAANVAYQMCNFTPKATLYCLIDELAANQINSFQVPFFGAEVNTPIPRKKRFYDGDYYLPRWDVEDKPKTRELNIGREKLLSILKDHIEEYELIILSDYGKGLFNDIQFCQDIIKICLDNNCKTIVDPKYGPLRKWEGCTYFKPNAKEAIDLTRGQIGLDDVSVLKTDLKCKNIIITHGGEKITGCIDGERFTKKLRPVRAQSVIGAGDCFSAFLAMALAYGFTLDQSIDIAHEAGSRYVQNRHNRPLTPRDLMPKRKAKVMPVEDLDIEGTVAFCNGCFDMLHEGHIQVLEYAKGLADKLIVGLNRDASIKRLKGEDRPIIPELERAMTLAGLECVDYVICFSEPTPLSLIQKIRPHVLAKGADWKKHEIAGAREVESWGGRVKRIRLVANRSTTRLLKLLKRA